MSDLMRYDEGCIHPRFNLEKAIELVGESDEFVLPRTSPAGIVRAQLWQDRYGMHGDEKYACDAMVFGKGSPRNPAATKFGGQPFWPVNQEWPTNLRGKPLFFLGQINFADSLDIVLVPAPLLFILSSSREESEWIVARRNHIKLYWCDPTTERCQHISTPTMFDGEYFACLHRMYDYPNEHVSDGNSHQFSVFDEAKIGGCPYYIQEFQLIPNEFFLGQLSGILGFKDLSYPWVNQASELDDYETPFRVVDAGLMYLFLRESGEVRWSLESH